MISKEMLNKMTVKELLELLNKFKGACRSVRFGEQAVSRDKKDGYAYDFSWTYLCQIAKDRGIVYVDEDTGWYYISDLDKSKGEPIRQEKAELQFPTDAEFDRCFVYLTKETADKLYAICPKGKPFKGLKLNYTRLLVDRAISKSLDELKIQK